MDEASSIGLSDQKSMTYACEQMQLLSCPPGADPSSKHEPTLFKIKHLAELSKLAKRIFFSCFLVLLLTLTYDIFD